MRLLLVRHGVTPDTGRILTGRLPGVSLNEQGVVQADALARRLAETRLAAVVTSPLERCRETAAALARGRGLRPRVDRRFVEVDYGRWSGRRLSDLRRLRAWSDLRDCPSRFRFPGGSETLRDAQERAVAAVEALASGFTNKTVAVVSHNDIIRLLLVAYLGMPTDLMHRLDVAPTSLSAVELVPRHPPVVPIVNQTVP